MIVPENGFADRDALLARNQRRYTTVTIDDVTVRIQSLMESERAAVEKESEGKELNKIRARFIVATVVDANGHRVFRDSDVEEVWQLDSRDTGWMFDVIFDHVGIGNNDVQDLAKNSGATQDDSSPTD